MRNNPLAEPDIWRLFKALRHQEPDGVPNFECRIKRRNLQAILGRPSGPDSTELPPGEYLELARRVHQDALHVGMRWELGFVYGTSSDGTRSYVDGAIQGPDDLKRVRFPRLVPFQTRLLPMVVEAGFDALHVDVREHIERLAAGGGYVVSSCHSIQDSIPPASFKVMLDAVPTCG